MKKTKVILIYLTGFLFLFFSSCSKKQKSEAPHSHGDHSNSSYYTCPMHPTVRSENPGACPICGMDLVEKHKQQQEQSKLDLYTCPMHPTVNSPTPGACPICGMDLVKKSANQSHENMIHLSERDQLLINLKTAKAEVKNISKNDLLLGKVVSDKRGLNIISAQVKGRIEKLHLRNPGQKVEKGQILYSLYSEDLLAAQTDYIQALKQRETFQNQKQVLEEIIKASKNKLLLWGQNESQINEIARNKKTSPYTNYYSKVSGFLSDLKITEGAYVEEGTPLFEVTDLESLWVEAQLYPNSLNSFKENSNVNIEFDAFPGEEFKGEFVYETPNLESNQKISLIRFKIKNTNNRIKPGMMAYVNLNARGKEALVVPKSALLMETMKSVWVESEKGMFERRRVETGVENKKEVEIISGVVAGEKVVTSGTYLINSEYILQNGGNVSHDH